MELLRQVREGSQSQTFPNSNLSPVLYLPYTFPNPYTCGLEQMSLLSWQVNLVGPCKEKTRNRREIGKR
jgi:hypothetical protein